jgi:hypothetical protein
VVNSTNFLDPDSVDCLSYRTTIHIEGLLSTNESRKGLLQEGSPPDFPLIDNMILYVEGNKQKKNFLNFFKFLNFFFC